MSRRNVNPWVALTALCFGFFMILLDTTIVSVAIPAMIKGLNASLNEIVWVTSGYLLAFAVPLLVSGRLGDRIGRKNMFIGGLAVFTLASLWCGLAGSAEMLIAARVVQGLGAAALTPQTMAFITTLFPPEKRGAPLGVWGGVGGLATIAGPLLGGVLVDNFGWQWIFMVNVPIGTVGVVASLFLLPGKLPSRPQRFDLVGTALSGLGLFAVVFGVQNGQQDDWGRAIGPVTSPELIAGGVLLLIAFVWWQRIGARRGTDPLMPLALFRYGNFTSAQVAGIAIGFALTGMFLPLAIYWQSVLGLSPLMAGLLGAPMSVMSGAVAPFAGKLSDRINGKWVALTGFVAMSLGVGILVLQARPDSNPWSFTPALLLVGFGVGCVFSPLANLATSGVPLPQMGAAAGVMNAFRQVGGVIGSAAIGVLLQARLTVTMHTAAVSNAATLPPQFRDRFIATVDAQAATASTGTGPAAAHATGLPAQVAAQLARAGQDAFRDGFTSAARATLILPLAVLVIGALACLLMSTRPKLTRAATPASTELVNEPA
ncbi:MAG TPA: DHA2 family efflux MFS transporter permease subunit [Pseudonocardiaceae bacterium]|nr:DHA2 family efflux MFS transporter permease subunit [Pseudonocardiaceae bacterium]